MAGVKLATVHRSFFLCDVLAGSIWRIVSKYLICGGRFCILKYSVKVVCYSFDNLRVWRSMTEWHTAAYP